MSAVQVDALRSVLNPVGDAQGLPNSQYTSDAAFDEEKLAILHASWMGIGFDSDVPEPGDVKPVMLLGIPLLLVRTHAGDISVFQNTCRHRGMILVQQPSNVRKVVRCPYHSWCYDLDGKLQVTPHVGGPGCNRHDSIDPDNLGLFKIASAVWLGVVFVNISGHAPEFDKHTESLRSRWNEFDGLDLHADPQSTFSLALKSNWKFAVENYCESYHLPWIHPGLNSYSKLEDHYNIEETDAYSGQGTSVYRQLQGAQGEMFADVGRLSEKWNTAAEYIALYPNVLLGVHRDHTFAIILEPVSTRETRERIAFFYTRECARDERFQALRQRNRDLWKTVFEEDIFVVEGMQAGRQGVLFDGGVFSPVMDSPSHNFHRWIATRLITKRAAVGAHGEKSGQ